MPPCSPLSTPFITPTPARRCWRCGRAASNTRRSEIKHPVSRRAGEYSPARFVVRTEPWKERTDDDEWVRHFREGHAGERDLLGGKGANLAEMTRIGLPVSPGFTITTDAFRAFRSNGGQVSDEVWAEVRRGAGRGGACGSTGNSAIRIARCSFRSAPGARFDARHDGYDSQCRIERETVEAWRDCRAMFALDSYRRLDPDVWPGRAGIPMGGIRSILAEARRAAGVQDDHELDVPALQGLVDEFRAVVREHRHGVSRRSVGPVARRGAGACSGRGIRRGRLPTASRPDLSHDGGTAVNVQAMVFGNLGDGCGTGVAFTRNPNTGEPGLFGEYLPNAQGEDVVAGMRTPLTDRGDGRRSDFAHALPSCFRSLRRLEWHFRRYAGS